METTGYEVGLFGLLWGGLTILGLIVGMIVSFFQRDWTNTVPFGIVGCILGCIAGTVATCIEASMINTRIENAKAEAAAVALREERLAIIATMPEPWQDLFIYMSEENKPKDEKQVKVTFWAKYCNFRGEPRLSISLRQANAFIDSVKTGTDRQLLHDFFEECIEVDLAEEFAVAKAAKLKREAKAELVNTAEGEFCPEEPLEEPLQTESSTV
jgi:hypothetical protein